MRESRNSESKGFAVNNEKLFDIEKGIKPKLPVVARLADPSGSPVTLVTGCSVTKFDESKLVRTATKAWFPGMEDYLCNVSLPIALRAAASGRRAIVQCAEAQCEMLRSLIATLPYSNNLSVLPADLRIRRSGSRIWSVCFRSLPRMRQSPVSTSFFTSRTRQMPLVHSFPPGKKNSDVLGAAIARRVVFFQSVSNYAYDLVLRHGQKEIRVQALTALASSGPLHISSRTPPIKRYPRRFCSHGLAKPFTTWTFRFPSPSCVPVSSIPAFTIRSLFAGSDGTRPNWATLRFPVRSMMTFRLGRCSPRGTSPR